MRILFVYPQVDVSFYGTMFLHMGLASLTSFIKQHGHIPAVMLATSLDKAELLKNIQQFKPDMVGFSSPTHQWEFIKTFGRWVKEETNLPIIFGGWHPTLAPEEAIAVPYVDYVCVGEGELPLTELLDRLQNGRSVDDVPGIWLRKGDTIIRNPIPHLIEDLDTLPFMDLETFDFAHKPYNMRKIEGFNHTLEIIAGRGCPHSCTFCCAKAFRDLYKEAGAGRYVRLRSPARTVEEIVHHIRKYPFIDSIGFYDDTFTQSAEWLAEFAPLYTEKVGLPFFATARVDTVNEEILDMLKAAGCFILFYGVETGNEELRNKMAKKHATDEQIRKAFRLTRERGIRTLGAFMVGLPYETKENFQETKRMMLELEPDMHCLSNFCPLPRTEAMDECRRNGWLNEHVPISYASGAGISMPWFTSDEIAQCVKELIAAFFDMQVKKKAHGYNDFAANFESARIQHPPEIPVSLGTMFDECYEVVWLLAHPPVVITYNGVHVRENTDLKFGIGVSEKMYDMPGGGVEFSVTVNGKKVFSKRLDPKRKKEDREWFFHTVPLDKFAGKDVSIAFITEAFGKGGNAHCSAGWGRPHLIERTAK